MAKVTGPLMSLDASGSIASTITFSKWKGRPYVRNLVKPSNPRTNAQTAQRAMFAFLSQQWAAITDPDKATWQAMADALKASPFNGYQKYNMDRWTQLEYPTMALPAIASASPDNPSALAAIGGVRQAQVNVTFTGATNEWGVIIYQNLVTGFTPAKNDVVGIILGVNTGIVSFVSSNLPANTYYYRVGMFGPDGAYQLYATQVSAVVTG
jgi:Family of unknown function (DUF6266)